VLARRLRRCGMAPHRFGWDTRRAGPDAAARRLAALVAGLDAPVVHLVAHSLGGLVAARLLADWPGAVPGRVILLGTPAGCSAAARRLGEFAAGRWLLGAAAQPLAAGWTEPPPPGLGDWGLAAGTRALGLGRLVCAGLSRPNDGTVSLAETRWVQGPPVHCMPVTHSGFLVSARAAQQVCHFLVQGSWLGASGGG